MTDQAGHFLPDLARLADLRRRRVATLLRRSRGAQPIRAYREALVALAGAAPHGAAVNIVHIGHASPAQANGAFPLYATACIASARKLHPDAICIVHAAAEPSGAAWDLVKDQVRFVRLPDLPDYRGAPVIGQEHAFDIARLVALEAVGGVFLSSDTIVLASLAPLAGAPFGMALQQATPGASPRVAQNLFFAQPGSAFASRWLDAYAGFPSDGTELTRRAFSGELPLHLYGQAAHEARMLPHGIAAVPLWSNVRRFLFAPGRAQDHLALLSEQYVLPLWGAVVGQELRKWSYEDVVEGDCLFALLASKSLGIDGALSIAADVGAA